MQSRHRMHGGECSSANYLTEQSLQPETTASSPSQHRNRARPPRADPCGRSEASATTPKSLRSHTRTVPSWAHVANASQRDPHATDSTGLFWDDDTCPRERCVSAITMGLVYRLAPESGTASPPPFFPSGGYRRRRACCVRPLLSMESQVILRPPHRLSMWNISGSQLPVRNWRSVPTESTISVAYILWFTRLHDSFTSRLVPFWVM